MCVKNDTHIQFFLRKMLGRLPGMDPISLAAVDSRDPILSDSWDPMIILSDSRDPIFNSRDPIRVLCPKQQL